MVLAVKLDVLCLNNVLDQGDGWASVFKSEIRLPYVKSIFPNAQSRPVTLNFGLVFNVISFFKFKISGMRMPAWYDILGLSTNSPEVKTKF